MNMRCDPRKYSLHWQHSAKSLSLRNPTTVSDGMDAQQFYAEAWLKRRGRKKNQVMYICSPVLILFEQLLSFPLR